MCEAWGHVMTLLDTCSIVHAVTEVIATIPHLSSVPSVNGSSTSQMIMSSRMIATYPGGHGVFLIRSHLLQGVVDGPRSLRGLRAELRPNCARVARGVYTP